jgi:hypothetical protein
MVRTSIFFSEVVDTRRNGSREGTKFGRGLGVGEIFGPI